VYACLVRQVSDAFLLNMAEVSTTLIGLFLIGVFFYVESGLRRVDRARQVFEPYLRAGTRITLIVFTIPLGLSLALVVSWSLPGGDCCSSSSASCSCKRMSTPCSAFGA
jgi:hypothetical protein